MTIFWFLMVALVLGGLLASLWYQETRRGFWARKVRVPAPVPAPRLYARSAPPLLASGNEPFAPPGLTARARSGR